MAATRALSPRAIGKFGRRQSKDKSHFYLTASKDSPYEQHLYEDGCDGGRSPPDEEPGKHATTVSPDGCWIADIYS